jgi:DNA-binding transcriptional LysR family regulator
MVIVPELRQFRHFIAVAERLNFTRAATDLSIAQQSLSSSIRQLEVGVGARLFERSTREVRLTRAGQALLPEARRAVAQAERALEAAQRAANGETGELRIGYVPPGGVELVTRLVGAFCGAHPGVQVSARELWAPEIAAGVRERSIDVGFVRFDTGGDGIRSAIVSEDEIVAVVGRGHRRAGEHELDLGELRGETLLLRPRSARFNAAILEACHDAGFDPPTLESPVIGNAGFFEPVARGLAFALVAAPHAARWSDERLAILRLRPPLRRLPMRMLWPAESAPPVVERFVALARRPQRSARSDA